MNTCTPAQEAYSSIPCVLPNTGAEPLWLVGVGLIILFVGLTIRKYR